MMSAQGFQIVTIHWGHTVLTTGTEIDALIRIMKVQIVNQLNKRWVSLNSESCKGVPVTVWIPEY